MLIFKNLEKIKNKRVATLVYLYIIDQYKTNFFREFLTRLNECRQTVLFIVKISNLNDIFQF